MYVRPRLGAAVNLKALVWGGLFTAAGVAVATSWLPGTAGMGLGPRLGATTLLITFGLTLIAMANASWFLRKTTRPEDYKGGCPVGESCAKCGSFNMKPRSVCRSCGVNLADASASVRSEAL